MEAHREEITLHKVALLAEGVDRNMAVDYVTGLVVAVALLAEGVDRNAVAFALPLRTVGSPSSRREWIEIYSPHHPECHQNVALLAEGVDRNVSAEGTAVVESRRPPHGEHTSNPLSIRLHASSFLQAGHRFGGRQPFPIQTSGGTAFCDIAAGLFCVGSLLQAPAVQTAEDAARRGEHIGHLMFLHDSGQIPAVAVITQQADPAELCCKVHLLR